MKKMSKDYNLSVRGLYEYEKYYDRIIITKNMNIHINNKECPIRSYILWFLK